MPISAGPQLGTERAKGPLDHPESSVGVVQQDLRDFS